MKSTSYTSSQKLACGECVSDVIICVDPLTSVSGLSGIDGQVVSFDEGTTCQGSHYYIYGITYDEGQLLDPEATITVLGIVCRGCLVEYLTGLISSAISFNPSFDVRNTSVGASALNPGTVTTGADDTAIGYGALQSNTAGNRNTAIGSGALQDIGAGVDLTAIGKDAGKYISGLVLPNTSSTSSVYLGANTAPLADGDTDEIVIGPNAVGLGSHTASIGSGTTVLAAIRGKLGVNGILAPTAQIHLPAGSAAAGTAPIKLTSGALLGVAEPGTIQFLADAYYGGITTGPATKQFVFTDGNVATAAALQTPRNINGVAFDGTADISVPSDIAPGAAGNVLTSTGALWSSAPSVGGGGTVTSVSVVSANGISGVVATATTTPAITLSLGNINPTSVNGVQFAELVTGFTITGGSGTPVDFTYPYPLVQKNANYTLTPTDYTVECTANSFNITLPTAVGATGQLYNVKNTGAGVITILTTGGQTVDGQASGFWQLNQWSNMQVQSNGANWIIL